MQDYLKVVEMKEFCYKKLYAAGRVKGFQSEAEVKNAVATCMGWDPGSVVSEGKPGTASKEEQEDALKQCLRSHCSWICKVSVGGVHEPYHVWYDHNERMWAVTLLAVAVVADGHAAMQQENILGEIGAHDAEAQYLRDTIADAEKKGNCSDLPGTVHKDERDRRVREAADRVKKYLDSL